MSKLLEQINTAPRTIKKLGEVFEIIDGDRGANYPSKTEFTKNGYCVFLNTKNVPSQGFDFVNVDFISKERDELLRKGKLERNDIVMTTRGTIGNVAHFSDSVPFDLIRINSGMVILRSKPDVDRSYLYTLIKSPIFNAQLQNTSSGSAQPQLPIKDLKEIELNLPDLPTQKKVASILSVYDEKMENNNKIIKNLEETAQTIFNEWFVNFQFPGYEKVKMIDSELGEIPEGWELKKLDEVFDISIGRTPPRQERNWFSKDPKDIKWVSIKDMGASGLYIQNTEEYLTKEAISKFNIPVIPKNTLIVSFKLTIGRLAITTEEMLSNEAIAHLKNNKNIVSSEYTYLFFKIYNFDSLGSTSSIANAVNSKSIKRIEILIPKKDLVRKFESIIKPFFENILIIQNESVFLKAQRDYLLAKLI
jgi:type I restriction enzyme S subunit